MRTSLGPLMTDFPFTSETICTTSIAQALPNLFYIHIVVLS